MRWHQGTIPEAIAQAKQQQAIFLVFIHGNDDQSKQMEETLSNSSVASTISDNCVALKLEATGEPVKQFSQIYPVVLIPSLFFIGTNGVPLEVIGGHVNANHLLEKINVAVGRHEQQKQSEITAVGSANGPGIPSFSPGYESDLASSGVPLEERVDRAKQLAADLRAKKIAEEQEKEKQREKERIQLGKALQQQKQRQKEQEMKQIAEDLAKEKAEEKAAREKIREQIARDRAERAAKYNEEKAMEEKRRQEIIQSNLQAEQERAAADAANRSRYARLQFRLPDGSSTNHQFDAGCTLEEVATFIKENVKPSFGQFKLSLTFPRREFQKNDFSQSLRDLQLAPSASLLVLPKHGTAIQSSGEGHLGFLWLILSPILALWRMLQAFLFGTGPPPTGQASGNRSSPAGSAASGSAQSTSRNPNNPSQARTTGEYSRGFGRPDGNIHRLPGQNGDDDENNTWNGNSTQQM